MVSYGSGGQAENFKYCDEIGPRVMHTYQVFNNGPWKVSNLEVLVNWPFRIANYNNWLLYLDETPVVEGQQWRWVQ